MADESKGTQEVFVTYNSERYSISADVDHDTFLDIKKQLEVQTGVPVAKQHLTAHKLGIKLEDDKSLHHYRLSGGGFFDLVMKK